MQSIMINTKESPNNGTIPIPRERKTKFLDPPSSNDDSITSSSGTKTIIIEKADVHQSAPPIPLPRKKLLLNQTTVSQKISLDSQSDEKNSDTNVIQKIPIITEVRAAAIETSANDDSDENKSVQFMGKKLSHFSTKSINSDKTESNTKSSIHNSVIKSAVPPKKSAISPIPLKNNVSIEIVNEKKFKKEKLAVLVEKSSSEDENGISIDKTETDSSNHSNSEDYYTDEKELKVVSKRLEKLKVSDLNSNGKKLEYNYEEIIAIYIHETSELKFDHRISSPMIKMSIMDGKSGKLLTKSDPNRNVVLNLEPKNLEFIQPIISKRCQFKSENFIQCAWEELLIINDDINHIMTGDVIIFFELLDILAKEKWKKGSDGWHYIAWAFLKPCNDSSVSNISRRNCLQFYKYKKNKFSSKIITSVIEEWQNLKKLKYPATLTVTVKGMKVNSNSVPLTRPIHAIQSERTTTQPMSHTIEQSDRHQILKNDFELEKNFNNEITANKILTNIPGQLFRFPNHIHKTINASNCLISKFSRDGKLLAFTTMIDRQFQIVITSISDMKIIRTLKGHTNIIYDLDWADSSMNSTFQYALISASSDRICIYWSWNENTVSMKILPHPTFLYAVRFLAYGQNMNTVVTGGRDGIIRIWKLYSNINTADLLQELEEHSTYVTSLSVSRLKKHIYSVDWNGLIIEWQCNNSNGCSYNILRKITNTHKTFSIMLHPHEDKIFAHSIDTIKCFDISTGIPIQTFNLKNHGSDRYKFTISPCGTFIFTTYQYKIIAWSLYASTQQYSFNLSNSAHNSKNFISSMNFHPNGIILSVTVYGENETVYLLSQSNIDLDNTYIFGNMNEIRVNGDNNNEIQQKCNSIVGNRKLNDIIRRVDAIFAFGLNHINQTDDHKVTEKNQKSTLTPTTVELLAEDQLNSSENEEDDDDDDSNRTYTLSKQSSVSSDNRTFNISNSVNNDGTYNVENEGKINPDDTDVSESM